MGDWGREKSGERFWDGHEPGYFPLRFQPRFNGPRIPGAAARQTTDRRPCPRMPLRLITSHTHTLLSLLSPPHTLLTLINSLPSAAGHALPISCRKAGSPAEQAVGPSHPHFIPQGGLLGRTGRRPLPSTFHSARRAPRPNRPSDPPIHNSCRKAGSPAKSPVGPCHPQFMPDGGLPAEQRSQAASRHGV